MSGAAAPASRRDLGSDAPSGITEMPLCSTGPTRSCDCPHALGLLHFPGAAMLLDTSLLPKKPALVHRAGEMAPERCLPGGGGAGL